MILVNFLSNLTLISQKIADKLREKLPDLNIDLSRLTNFVNSRKDHDVVFTLRDITVTQVLNILKRVTCSPNKSAGIDGTNARLFRLAAPIITLSIARMINYSFSFGTFPHRWKPVKLPLCSKKVMQATHPIIVQFLSLQSYLRLLKNTSTILWMTFFKWTTWFTTSSPGLFLRRNGRLLDVFRQSGFRKQHGSETALFKNESSGADPGFCLGGGVLVSCSTSTPINHIVFLQNTIVLENRSSSQRGCAPPAPSP